MIFPRYTSYTSIVVTAEKTQTLKSTVTKKVMPERRQASRSAHRSNTAAAIVGAVFFAAFGVLIWAAITSPITSYFFLATLGTSAGLGLVAIALLINADRKDRHAECLQDICDSFVSEMHERAKIQPHKAFEKMNNQTREDFLTLLDKHLNKLLSKLNEEGKEKGILETGLATKGCFGISERMCSLRKVVKQTKCYKENDLLISVEQRVNSLNDIVYEFEQRESAKQTISTSDLSTKSESDISDWESDNEFTEETD